MKKEKPKTLSKPPNKQTPLPKIHILFHFQKNSSQMQVPHAMTLLLSFLSLLLGISRNLRTQLTWVLAFSKAFQVDGAVESKG